MTVEALPWSIHGQSHNATVARNAIAAIMGAPVAALTAGSSITTAGGSHGVIGGADLAVTQNGTPNMSVNVAAGRAIIRGTETASALQGAYSFINDGTVNLTIAAADASNPRRDLIVAQVRDANYSGADNDARLTVITGTPAGVPADPAVPNSCVVLARVAVAAAATSIVTANITDLRTFATAIGGIHRCLSTRRPSGASLYEGLYIDEADTERLWRYTGSGWMLVGGKMPRVSVTNSAAEVMAVGFNNPTWDTENYDADSMHTGTANGLVVPTDFGGRWLVSYYVSTSLSTASGDVFVQVNGAGKRYMDTSMANGAMVAATEIIANAGDQFTLSVYNGTAGAGTMVTNTYNYFQASYLGV